ncbi:MAG: AMP-binding protein [Chloroflexi bacterium]|nr:AMP-binding protein [Chloroflexota bacterium]
MRLEYRTLADARKRFTWAERWEVFDKGPDTLNIAFECVDRHPKENIAIRLQNADGTREQYTFGELACLTSRFANMLEKCGVSAGDRVAIALEPSLQYYVSFYGALKRGAVAVPCYQLLGSEGMEYRLKSSGASVLVIGREAAERVRLGQVQHVFLAEELIDQIAEQSDEYHSATSGDTLAVIQFSSGTTGQPSQARYNHDAVTITAVFTKFWLGLRQGDVYMCTSSPAWGHGIWYGTVAPLIFGNGIGAYSGKFDPRMCLEGMEAFGVTVVSAIPRVYKMLLDTGAIDNYKLQWRTLTYTGAEMNPELTKQYLDRFNIYIRATYGNTELGPVVIDYAFDDWKPRIGSCGKPMLGVKLGILDDDGGELPPGEVGKVAVWRNEQWNYLGDYGRFDEDGYFYALGRADDVIKSSGYRIGPFEIEAALDKHPVVVKSAVVGSPDEERGEIVKAFIVLQDGVQGSEELKQELQEFVKTKVSMHEYPKEIEFIDTLPQTADGKLKRRELKEMEYRKKQKPIGVG